MFDRKAALKMAAEHNSFTSEQLGIWTDMYYAKGLLTDSEIKTLSVSIPAAKIIDTAIEAAKLLEPVEPIKVVIPK